MRTQTRVILLLLFYIIRTLKVITYLLLYHLFAHRRRRYMHITLYICIMTRRPRAVKVPTATLPPNYNNSNNNIMTTTMIVMIYRVSGGYGWGRLYHSRFPTRRIVSGAAGR